MTAFKAFIGFTLLATGSCSSRSRPQADKGYEVCRNPLKWSTPGCKKLFETMKTEDTSDSTSSERIINGVNVPFGEYPWFAEPLEYWGGWYDCGAMLVSPEFILTAAHCIEDDVDDETTKYKVGAVCHRQNQNNCGQSSETLIVAERFSHPSYDSAGWDYDVALVKLAETASTTPVDMDLEGTVNSYNSNSKLRVIGFGDTNPDEGNYGSVQELPNHLQHVEVSYVPHATCNANYGGIITNNMMCAADPGEGRCRGDSGGPLYDDVNNLLVGVVSWGYGCAATGYPGVYSKIYSHADWIRSTICENHSTPLPSFCVGYTPLDTGDDPLDAPPGESCNDLPWTDNWGDDCSWYALPGECDKSEQYANDEGVGAADACCVCGGGEQSEEVTVDDPPDKSCNDLPDWADSWSGDCSLYSGYCHISEQYANDEGIGAAEACCICGGGDTAHVEVTADDPPDETCMDSPTRVVINKKKKSCNWVAKKASTRCQKKGVASHCPEACSLCSEYKCADSEKKWYLQNGNVKKCGWVDKANTEERCAMEGVQQTCRATCGQCE